MVDNHQKPWKPIFNGDGDLSQNLMDGDCELFLCHSNRPKPLLLEFDGNHCKTIDLYGQKSKNSQWWWFYCSKTIEKTIDSNGTLKKIFTIPLLWKMTIVEVQFWLYQFENQTWIGFSFVCVCLSLVVYLKLYFPKPYFLEQYSPKQCFPKQ